ncbi:26S proteasome complex subunit SEM1 [Polyrhizophydium stewartii]|uniref:26S proteasome complex subunit SEM1 n=1 Tax=Polyrhizophydium stewartii TaxID=2732419 RepID=A0ABR4N2E8_9FUNG
MSARPSDDDEFQDFRQDDWQEADEDHEDARLWLEDWDNEEFDDEFTRQLRAELVKMGASLASASRG